MFTTIKSDDKYTFICLFSTTISINFLNVKHGNS